MGHELPAITEEQQEIKSKFVEGVGYWNDKYDLVLQLDPDWFDTFRKLAAHPHNKGNLDAKERELILISVNCAVTHLHTEAVRVHVRNAMEFGATFEEILEVFHRKSGTGIHAISVGIPILKEEAGLPDDHSEETVKKHEEFREKYREERGYWNDSREDLLQMDHEFLDHYTEMSSYPFRHGPLSLKMKEYVSIANNASTTHLYTPGLRTHIRNALELGATRDELVEVLELVSYLGIQTQADCGPILVEEARKKGLLPEHLREDEHEQ